MRKPNRQTMNLCKCGCGELVQKNYKRGHARRGKRNSTEHNESISKANTGKKRTEEQNQKNRERGLGRHFSEDTRVKMSYIAKEKGFGKWMMGRKLPEETIKKMSEIQIGHTVSDDTRKKIAEANDGYNNGMYGRHHTEEAKEKIAEAAVAMWENQDIRSRLIESFNTPEHIEMLRQRRAGMVFPLKDTTIEIIVREFLDILKIPYKQHKVITDIIHKYQCDFYIESYKLVIECDGDYWHNYPNGRDIDSVRTLEMKQNGYKVLRLWEHTIRKMSCDDFSLILNQTIDKI